MLHKEFSDLSKGADKRHDAYSSYSDIEKRIEENAVEMFEGK